jgi:hypothetical protein
LGNFRDAHSRTNLEKQFCEGMQGLHAAVKSLVQSHRARSAKVLRELNRIRADCEAVLASNLAARKVAQSRAYQLRIQKLELDRLRAKQSAAFEAVEREAAELTVMSEQVKLLAMPDTYVAAWQQLVIELRELQAHVEDHSYGEMGALTAVAGRELNTGMEELRSDVMELHIELEQWGRRMEAPDRVKRGRGEQSLADVAMEKLLRMRKQREAATAELYGRRRQ